MFSIIVILLAMILASIGLAIAIRRKTEECLPIVFLGTIVVLYIFYCLNFLHIGRFFVYAALAELIVMGAILLFKSDEIKKKFFKDYFTIALAIFIGLSIAILIFAHNLRPNLWDELRLWAAEPKAMFYIGDLQIGNNAVLYPEMQSYPPAMSLLAYFFTSISGKYFEAAPFISMVVFGFALIVSALKKITWKMWPLVAPIVAIIIIMPCILTSGASEMSGDWAYYYLSLFIDMILGTLVGFGLFLAINKPFDNWYDTIKFSLAMFVMPCIKNTGAVFAFIVFLVALAIKLFDFKADHRVVSLNAKRKYIVAMIVSILSIAISYFSWQLLINIKGSGEYADIFAFSIGKETIKIFCDVLVSWGKIPLVVFFAAFIVIDLLITLLLKDIKKRDMLIAMIGMFVAIVIFYIGYLNTYSDYFASIIRYSSLLLFMMYVYLFMRFTSNIKIFEFARLKSLEGKIYTRRFFTMIIIVAASIAILVVSFTCLALWKKNVQINSKANRAKEIVKNINLLICENENVDNFSIKSPAKVYIVLKGPYRKNSQLHEACLYESIGTLCYIKNVSYDNALMFSNQDELDLYEKATEHDRNSEAKLSQILRERLAKEEYDYIYIDDIEAPEENIVKGAISGSKEVGPKMLISLK